MRWLRKLLNSMLFYKESIFWTPLYFQEDSQKLTNTLLYDDFNIFWIIFLSSSFYNNKHVREFQVIILNRYYFYFTWIVKVWIKIWSIWWIIQFIPEIIKSRIGVIYLTIIWILLWAYFLRDHINFIIKFSLYFRYWIHEWGYILAILILTRWFLFL